MPSIYPVPLTSAQGVGNAPALSAQNQRAQMTFAISGLSMDVAKGQRLDAVLKFFMPGKNPQLLFPGNAPIDLDAQVAALLVPKASESMNLSFSILRQNPGAPVELMLLKATPLASDTATKTPPPATSTTISSAGLSLQQALSSTAAPLSAGPTLPPSATAMSVPGSLISASALQALAASGTSVQSVLQLAQAFSAALPQIPSQMGLGYERNLANWVEKGADLGTLNHIKNQFPQAQNTPNNPYITQSATGALTPSALSIGQQALSIEQHGFTWNGALTPNIQAQMSLNLVRPADFPAGFTPPSSKDDAASDEHNPQSFSSKQKQPTYLRMHLSLEGLQDAYIWGIHYQGINRVWVRFVNPQSAKLIEQILPLFTQTFMDKHIELTLLSQMPHE